MPERADESPYVQDAIAPATSTALGSSNVDRSIAKIPPSASRPSSTVSAAACRTVPASAAARITGTAASPETMHRSRHIGISRVPAAARVASTQAGSVRWLLARSTVPPE